MSQEQKLQQERLFKCHEEAITSIINSNTTTTKQRLDLLSKKINKQKQGWLIVRPSKKYKSIDAFEDIITDKLYKMNEKLTN